MTDESPERPLAQWVLPSDENLCVLYANMAHVMWSIDDLTVRFAQLVPASGNANRNPGETFVAVAEERANVTISWRVAKLLRDQLTATIDNYEKANGPVNMAAILAPAF